ncbi:MAG TPA: TonB-dependent receptor [Gemmatimonadota bacterium]|nr:TonB-dependent receptor [Gemmatimonadota bacterium]
MQHRGAYKSTARLALPVLGAFALLALGAGPAFAQITGKVVGTVTDRDTGEPLVGAQVVVEGTNLGNVTNEDGWYFINNVAVGIQQITAQYLGYQTTAQEHRILAGQTMTVEFQLASEVIEADEAIIAVIEREPLVARDNTISKTRFTFEEARNLPVESLDEVISLSAGIYEGQGGFIIRGGRGSEAATYVDGALVTDFGTQRAEGAVGVFAIEEVDVVTGGFNAEFGHAQSGVINIVTREGGREYHGNVRFTTDGRFGTDGYDLAELATGTIPEEQSCCGYNEFQASIGGPIVPDKLTFFASLAASGAADNDPRSAGFNPAVGSFNSSGSTETILPGARGDDTRAQAKVTAFLTGTSKLIGTYLYSRDQNEGFCLSCSLSQFLSTADRQKTHDIILGFDQQIYQTPVRSLNLQVRGNYHQTKLATGTPKNPTSAAVLNAQDRLAGRCTECNVDEHTFDDDFLNYRFGDVEFFFEDAIPGDPELLNVGSTRATNPDPIFGHSQVFVTEGFSNSFFNREEDRYGIRVDLDAQLNRVHRAKVGGEYTQINFSQRGVRFTDSTFGQLFDVEPRVAALYAQDRLDYGDLVIDLGLRLDHWDPNTMFPLFPGIVPCSISAFPQCSDPADNDIAVLVEGRTRTELAPRLGVAHPITDATQVRLSYGKFHQLPELRHYFSAFATDFVAGAQNPNVLYGNPNLDYVETTAFEAGITHLISQDLVLDVVGYNRDRRGAIRVDVFQPGIIDPGVEERRIFVNGDNGNVKGVDLTLSKRYSNYFSADVAYSLQFARGTTSSPTEFATGGGFGRLFDPLFPGRLLVPPSELLPESFDRQHSANLQFALRFPDEFQEGTAVGTIFNDFGVYLVYNAHSGEPFTRRSLVGLFEPLEDINSSRLPWFHQGDVRVTKGLDLGGALDLELFAQVLNFLDTENVINVNPTTGRPDRTGLEDNLSRTPTITSGFRTADSRQDYPFVIATDIKPEFQSRFARQDLNGDGSISLAEAQETLRQALIASGSGATFSAGTGDSPFNYGQPRQVRFGAEIRF